jgi:hypothetical protein
MLEKFNFERVGSKNNTAKFEETEEFFHLFCDNLGEELFQQLDYTRYCLSITEEDIKDLCGTECKLCLRSHKCIEKYGKNKLILILKTFIEDEYLHEKEIIIDCYKKVSLEKEFIKFQYSKK